MTAQRCASAPGKVVLSGEYAVLGGAPAIAMAIDRRAYASVTDSAAGKITAPGFSTEEGQFACKGREIEWLGDGQKFEVLSSVWRALESLPPSTFSVDLNSEAFVDEASGSKIGIGSSAAVTVALCAALAGNTEVKMAARTAHLDMQGGLGSGLDIACSLAGGLVEYRMQDSKVRPLEWPRGLAFRLLWSGVSASTRDKIAQLDAAKEMPSRSRLAQAADDNANAWRSGDADTVLAGNSEYNHHLRAFSDDYGLEIFGAGHEFLWRAAERANLSYKPCGAGGGDVGIAMARDETALDAFVADLGPRCKVLNCELEPGGVRMEERGVM